MGLGLPGQTVRIPKLALEVEAKFISIHNGGIDEDVAFFDKHRLYTLLIGTFDRNEPCLQRVQTL
jgi:hypothetical protein